MGLPQFFLASDIFAQARTDDLYAMMRKKTLLARLRSSSNDILKNVKGKIGLSFQNIVNRSH